MTRPARSDVETITTSSPRPAASAATSPAPPTRLRHRFVRAPGSAGMEFEPRDRAAYLPAADALVCADLHVGRDETSDVAFRLGEHEDLVERFDALCRRYEPREVVVAGDLLHSFSGLPTGDRKSVV